jgi:hypothetical protein
MGTSGRVHGAWTAIAFIALWGVGCSTTNTAAPPTRTRGVAGESCQVHDDCKDGLSCVHQVCVSGPESMEKQRDGGAPPITVSLGGRGESCTSRADCSAGLACLNNVCADPTETHEDAGALVVVGKRGESCRTRADCGDNLACIGGACTLADFGVSPTTKKCKLVQCKVPADCCPMPSSSCPFYQDFCNQGEQTYCDLYDTNCKCDDTKWACTDDKCVLTPTCDSTHPCTSPLVCAGTKCVQCAMDTDCPNGKCLDNKCVTKCQTDGDCPYFNKCQSGACVKTGCTTNRECIASTGNVQSLCQMGDCLVPCQSDLECDNALHFNFHACVSGYCKDVGCETDEECRILLKAMPASMQDAVCQ